MSRDDQFLVKVAVMDSYESKDMTDSSFEFVVSFLPFEESMRQLRAIFDRAEAEIRQIYLLRGDAV